MKFWQDGCFAASETLEGRRSGIRARACMRCRQWKLRCEVDLTRPDARKHCRSQSTPCAFDSRFRRVSKDKRLKELQAEVDQLNGLLLVPRNHLQSQVSFFLGLERFARMTTASSNAAALLNGQSPGQHSSHCLTNYRALSSLPYSLSFISAFHDF